MKIFKVSLFLSCIIYYCSSLIEKNGTYIYNSNVPFNFQFLMDLSSIKTIIFIISKEFFELNPPITCIFNEIIIAQCIITPNEDNKIKLNIQIPGQNISKEITYNKLTLKNNEKGYIFAMNPNIYPFEFKFYNMNNDLIIEKSDYLFIKPDNITFFNVKLAHYTLNQTNLITINFKTNQSINSFDSGGRIYFEFFNWNIIEQNANNNIPCLFYNIKPIAFKKIICRYIKSQTNIIEIIHFDSIESSKEINFQIYKILNPIISGSYEIQLNILHIDFIYKNISLVNQNNIILNFNRNSQTINENVYNVEYNINKLKFEETTIQKQNKSLLINIWSEFSDLEQNDFYITEFPDYFVWSLNEQNFVCPQKIKSCFFINDFNILVLEINEKINLKTENSIILNFNTFQSVPQKSIEFFSHIYHQNQYNSKVKHIYQLSDLKLMIGSFFDVKIQHIYKDNFIRNKKEVGIYVYFTPQHSINEGGTIEIRFPKSFNKFYDVCNSMKNLGSNLIGKNIDLISCQMENNSIFITSFKKINEKTNIIIELSIDLPNIIGETENISVISYSNYFDFNQKENGFIIDQFEYLSFLISDNIDIDANIDYSFREFDVIRENSLSPLRINLNLTQKLLITGKLDILMNKYDIFNNNNGFKYISQKYLCHLTSSININNNENNCQILNILDDDLFINYTIKFTIELEINILYALIITTKTSTDLIAGIMFPKKSGLYSINIDFYPNNYIDKISESRIIEVFPPSFQKLESNFFISKEFYQRIFKLELIPQNEISINDYLIIEFNNNGKEDEIFVLPEIQGGLKFHINNPKDLTMECFSSHDATNLISPTKIICEKISKSLKSTDEIYFDIMFSLTLNIDENNPIIIYSLSNNTKTNYNYALDYLKILNIENSKPNMVFSLNTYEISKPSKITLNLPVYQINIDDFIIINFHYDANFESNSLCSTSDQQCKAILLKNIGKIIIIFYQKTDYIADIILSISGFINPNHTLSQNQMIIDIYIIDLKNSLIKKCIVDNIINFQQKEDTLSLAMGFDPSDVNVKSKFNIKINDNFTGISGITIYFPKELIILSEKCVITFSSEVFIDYCYLDKSKKLIYVKLLMKNYEIKNLCIETGDESIINPGGLTSSNFKIDFWDNLDFFNGGNIVKTINQRLPTIEFDPSDVLDLKYFDISEEAYDDEIIDKNSIFGIKFKIIPELSERPEILRVIFLANTAKINNQTELLGNLLSNKFICMVNEINVDCISINSYFEINIKDINFETDKEYLIQILFVSNNNDLKKPPIEPLSRDTRLSIFFENQNQYTINGLYTNFLVFDPQPFKNLAIKYFTSCLSSLNGFIITFDIDSGELKTIVIEFPIKDENKNFLWDFDDFYEGDEFPCAFGINNKNTDNLLQTYCFFQGGNKNHFGSSAFIFINNFKSANLDNAIYLTGFLNPSTKDLELPLKVYGYSPEKNLLFYQETKNLFITTDSNKINKKNEEAIFFSGGLGQYSTIQMKTNILVTNSFYIIQSNGCKLKEDVNNNIKLKGTKQGSEIEFLFVKSLAQTYAIITYDVKDILCYSAVNLFIAYHYNNDKINGEVINYKLKNDPEYIKTLPTIDKYLAGDYFSFEFSVSKNNYADNIGLIKFKSFYQNKVLNLFSEEDQKKLILEIKFNKPFFSIIKDCQVLNGLQPINVYSTIYCEFDTNNMRLLIKNFKPLSILTPIIIYIKFDSSTIIKKSDLGLQVGYFYDEFSYIQKQYLLYKNYIFTEIKEEINVEKNNLIIDFNEDITGSSFNIVTSTFTYDSPVNKFFEIKISFNLLLEINFNDIKEVSIQDAATLVRYYLDTSSITSEFIKFSSKTALNGKQWIFKMTVTNYRIPYYNFFLLSIHVPLKVGSSIDYILSKYLDFYNTNIKKDLFSSIIVPMNILVPNEDTIFYFTINNFPIQLFADKNCLIITFTNTLVATTQLIDASSQTGSEISCLLLKNNNLMSDLGHCYLMSSRRILITFKYNIYYQEKLAIKIPGFNIQKSSGETIINIANSNNYNFDPDDNCLSSIIEKKQPLNFAGRFLDKKGELTVEVKPINNGISYELYFLISFAEDTIDLDTTAYFNFIDFGPQKIITTNWTDCEIYENPFFFLVAKVTNRIFFEKKFLGIKISNIKILQSFNINETNNSFKITIADKNGNIVWKQTGTVNIPSLPVDRYFRNIENDIFFLSPLLMNQPKIITSLIKIRHSFWNLQNQLDKSSKIEIVIKYPKSEIVYVSPSCICKSDFQPVSSISSFSHKLKCETSISDDNYYFNIKITATFEIILKEANLNVTYILSRKKYTLPTIILSINKIEKNVLGLITSLQIIKEQNPYEYGTISITDYKIIMNTERIYVYPFYGKKCGEIAGPMRLFFKLPDLININYYNYDKIIIKNLNDKFQSDSNFPIKCCIRSYDSDSFIYKRRFLTSKLSCILDGKSSIIIDSLGYQFNKDKYYELIIKIKDIYSIWENSNVRGILFFEQKDLNTNQFITIEFFTSSILKLKSSKKLVSFNKCKQNIFKISKLYFAQTENEVNIFIIFKIMNIIIKKYPIGYLQFTINSYSSLKINNEFPCYVKTDCNMLDSLSKCYLFYNENKMVVIRLENNYDLIENCEISISFEAISTVGISDSFFIKLSYFENGLLINNLMNIYEIFKVENNIRTLRNIETNLNIVGNNYFSLKNCVWKSEYIFDKAIDISKNNFLQLQFNEKSILGNNENFNNIAFFFGNNTTNNLIELYRNQKTRNIYFFLKNDFLNNNLFFFNVNHPSSENAEIKSSIMFSYISIDNERITVIFNEQISLSFYLLLQEFISVNILIDNNKYVNQLFKYSINIKILNDIKYNNLQINHQAKDMFSYCYLGSNKLGYLTINEGKIEIYNVKKLGDFSLECVTEKYFNEIVVYLRNDKFVEAYINQPLVKNIMTQTFSSVLLFNLEIFFSNFYMSSFKSQSNSPYSEILPKFLRIILKLTNKTKIISVDISNLNQNPNILLECSINRFIKNFKIGGIIRIKDCSFLNGKLNVDLSKIQLQNSYYLLTFSPLNDQSKLIMNNLFIDSKNIIITLIDIENKQYINNVNCKQDYLNNNVSLIHSSKIINRHDYIEIEFKTSFLNFLFPAGGPTTIKNFIIEINFDHNSYPIDLGTLDWKYDKSKVNKIKSGDKFPCLITTDTGTNTECIIFFGDKQSFNPKILINLSLNILDQYIKIVLPNIKNINEENKPLNIKIKSYLFIMNKIMYMFKSFFINEMFTVKEKLESIDFNIILSSTLILNTNQNIQINNDVLQQAQIKFLTIRLISGFNKQNFDLIEADDYKIRYFPILNLFYCEYKALNENSFKINLKNLVISDFNEGFEIEISIFNYEKEIYYSINKLTQKSLPNILVDLNFIEGFMNYGSKGKILISTKETIKITAVKKIVFSLFQNLKYFEDFIFGPYCLILNSFDELKDNFLINLFSCSYNSINNEFILNNLNLQISNPIKILMNYKLEPEIEINNELNFINNFSIFGENNLINLDFKFINPKNISNINSNPIILKPNADQCLIDFIKLDNGFCQIKCPLGKYMDVHNNICIDCNKSCQNCSKELCFSCKNDFYFLFNGICFEKKSISFSIKNTTIPTLFIILFNDTFKQIDEFNKIINIKINILSNDDYEYIIIKNESNILEYKINFNFKKEIENDLTITFEFKDLLEADMFFISKKYEIFLSKSLLCPKNKIYDFQKQNCQLKTQIDPKLYNTLDPTLLRLKFQKGFGDLFEKLKQKLSIEIENEPNLNFTYEITRDESDLDLFLIRLKSDSHIRGNPILKLKMDYSEQELYTSENFFYLSSNETSLVLHDYVPISKSTQELINITSSFSSSVNILGTAIGTTVIISAPGSSFCITTLIAIGMIKYMKFFDIDFPPNVIAIYLEKVGVDGMWKFLHHEENVEDGEISNNFYKYGISIYLLNNDGRNYFLIFILMMFGLAIKISENIFDKFKIDINFKQTFYFLKIIFVWNAPLIILTTWILNFILFSFLNLVFPTLKTGYGYFNFLLSLFVFLVFTVIFPIYLNNKRKAIRSYIFFENQITVFAKNEKLESKYKSNENLNDISENEFQKLRSIQWLLGAHSEIHDRISGYFIIYKDFKFTNLFQSFYFIFSIIRCILFIVFIVVLSNYPLVGITLCLILNFIFVTFLIIFRPNFSKIDEIQTIFNEINVFATYICCLILVVIRKNDKYIDYQIILNIGWAIVFFNTSLWMTIFIRFLYELILNIIDLIKKVKTILAEKMKIQHKKQKLKKEETILKNIEFIKQNNI